MIDRFKNFSDFSDLSEENSQEFCEFEKFNQFLERELVNDYLKIYNSYIKIILGDTDYSNYSELDFQIKLLVDEVKVPVNKILEFAELKFKLLNDIILELIDDLYNIDKDDSIKITEYIFKEIVGIININLIDRRPNSNKNYKIHFNINKDISLTINELREKIKEVNLYISQNRINLTSFQILH